MAIFAMKGKSGGAGHASLLQCGARKVRSALHKAWLLQCPQAPVHAGVTADRAQRAVLPEFR